jgi:ketosteroid isomerase-like protein
LSEENVALVRGLIEAGAQINSDNKEEFLSALLRAVEQLFDAEVEWIEAPERVDARTFRGHDGIVDSWRRWLEDFNQYEVVAERYEDHGERVLVAGRERGRGLGSGVPTESAIYSVFTVKDGRILRYEEFYDETAARDAAST